MVGGLWGWLSRLLAIGAALADAARAQERLVHVIAAVGVQAVGGQVMQATAQWQLRVRVLLREQRLIRQVCWWWSMSCEQAGCGALVTYLSSMVMQNCGLALVKFVSCAQVRAGGGHPVLCSSRGPTLRNGRGPVEAGTPAPQVVSVVLVVLEVRG